MDPEYDGELETFYFYTLDKFILVERCYLRKENYIWYTCLKKKKKKMCPSTFKDIFYINFVSSNLFTYIFIKISKLVCPLFLTNLDLEKLKKKL